MSPRILTRAERAGAIELTAAELHRLAERVEKLDPSDKGGMRDAEEACEIIAGSLKLMRDDVLTEEQEARRLS